MNIADPHAGRADSRSRHLALYLHESAALRLQMLAACGDQIFAAADLITAAFRENGKLLLCGNGGSAADCQHLAAEFTSRLTGDFLRPGLPALALTTDTSFLTAYANDHDFDGVFARQVQALGRPGDVLLGISTSGNSRNVIRGLEAAQRGGLRTVALTGDGGTLARLADVCVAIPSQHTAHVQEAHLAIEHLLCHFVERALFGAHGLQAHTPAA